MKQYKHKQTSEMAEEVPENGPLAKYKVNHGFIAAHFVENTQDWEEIVKAPEWVKCVIKDSGVEIGKIYKPERRKSWTLSNNGCGEVYYINSAPYYTNQFIEFTPFFITDDGVPIEERQVVYWVNNNNSTGKPYFLYLLCFNRFHKAYKDWHRDDSTYKVFSTQEAADAYIASKTPKVLYTTEDNVEIYNREEYKNLWGVGLQCNSDDILKKSPSMALNSTPPTNRKWFYSKEKAEKYIEDNQKRYSLNDIRKCLDSTKEYQYHKTTLLNLKVLFG